jgi:hypothetical protein
VRIYIHIFPFVVQWIEKGRKLSDANNAGKTTARENIAMKGTRREKDTVCDLSCISAVCLFG